MLSGYYFLYAMCGVCVILSVEILDKKMYMHTIHQYIYIARERVLKHKHVNTHD